MTVLVTGATGFIGRRLVPRLQSLGHRVIGLNRSMGDIRDAATFEALHGERIGDVYHLAGLSSITESWQRIPDYVHANVLGATRVAEFCRDHGSSLTLVSSYMYGRPRYLPIDEAHPVAAANPYALSKRLAEEAVLFYAREFDLKCVILRPFMIYGPGQSDTFLIPSVVRQAVHQETIEVDDLHPSKRDYLFVDDFIDALIRTLSPREGVEIYNIAYGTSYTVSEVIALTQVAARTQKGVVSRHRRRLNEYPDLVASVEKARTKLGWVAKTSLEAGLAQCVAAERAR